MTIVDPQPAQTDAHVRIGGFAISRRMLLRTVAGAVLVLLLGVIVAPRASPYLLVMCAAIAGGTALAMRGRAADAVAAMPVGGVILAFSGYLLINAGWSLDGDDAYKLAVMLIINAGLGFLLVRFVGSTGGELLSRLGLALLVAFAVGVTLLCIEALFGQQVKMFLYNHVDLVRPPSNKHFVVDGNEIVRIAVYHLNRNFAAASLLFWPAVLVAAYWPERRMRRALLIGFAALTGVAVAVSTHETSKLALAGGTVCLLVTRWSPRWGLRLLLLGWLGLVAAVVPVAYGAFHAKLYEASWLPRSARARIVLWGFTAEQYLHNPLLGIGVNSTRRLDEQLKPNAKTLEGAPYGLHPGRHSHNIYLQIWFELGALGAVLLGLFGVLVIRRLSLLAEAIRPYAYAAFAAAMLTGSSSYGLWQPWFGSIFAFGALSLAIACRFASEDAGAFFASPSVSRRANADQNRA